MKIFNKYKNFYFIFLGLFWILVFIYYRFIVKKSEYNLEQLKTIVSFEYLICHLFFILLHCSLIIYAIYLLVMSQKSPNNKESIFMAYIKKCMNIILIKPLTSIKELIAPHIPLSGTIFCHFGTFLVKRDYEFLTKCFVIIFNIIPRITVSIIFFIEIVFYKRIYYFIPCLSLLLLHLFWILFIDLFTSFGERMLQDLPGYIKIEPKGNMLPNGYYQEYTFEPFDKFEYEPGEFEDYKHLWYLSMNIYCFGISYFKKFQQKSAPYVILFNSPLYLFATIYKLIYILF